MTTKREILEDVLEDASDGKIGARLFLTSVLAVLDDLEAGGGGGTGDATDAEIQRQGRLTRRRLRQMEDALLLKMQETETALLTKLDEVIAAIVDSSPGGGGGRP